MPKHVPKIGFAGHVGESIYIELSADQMQQVHAAYGEVLPIEAWFKVRLVTGLTKLAISSERQQLPTKTFLQEMQGLKGRAQELRDGIYDEPSSLAQSKMPTDPDELSNSTTQSRAHLTFPFSEDEKLFFRWLDVVDEFIMVSELLAKEMSKPTYQGFRPSMAWNKWIRMLTLIVREYGLSFKVRKDVDKKQRERASPFVRFVYELQQHLPEEFRLFMHSKDALAQAIVRARQGLNLARTWSEEWGVTPGESPWVDEMNRRQG
jgi:hypothetical protein